MPKRNWLAISGAGLLLAALLAGLLYFAGLASPAAFPAMSSLNSGRDGAKLLFDTLAGIPELTVSRNYVPLSSWQPHSSVVFMLGVKPNSLNQAGVRHLQEFEQLSQPGNRLILAVDDNNFDPKADAKLLLSRWGARLVTVVDPDDEDEPHLSLSHDGSWHELGGVGDAWAKQWKAGGTLVIVLHAEQLSNEKIMEDTKMQSLIPPLIAGARSVAFDETHLGVEESGSVMGLARHYRLQGLLAGLLLLAALFIWNRSVSFPPPPLFAAGFEMRVAGADAQAIFASLIAKHLAPQVLIEACMAEWNRVRPRQRLAIGAERKLDPIATYRQIQESLQHKSNRL